jgi:hypothetical protein
VEQIARRATAPCKANSEHELAGDWVCVRLAAADREEVRALVIAAWLMCVPKKVAAAYGV